MLNLTRSSALALLALLGLALVAVGCPDDDDDSSVTDDDDAATDDDDAATDDDDAATDDDDSAEEVTGSLSGDVTRVTDLTDDGVGDLFVIVADRDPFTTGGDFDELGSVRIEGADFTADGAVVSYVIPDVVAGPDPVFVLAIFDDNDNAPAGDPQPDPGDLINGTRAGLPSVTIDGEGDFVLDLELTMPFEL